MPSVKKRSLFVFLLAALASALFLTSPARYAKSVLEGISVWAVSVLPSVFPFLFLSALMTGLPPFRAISRKLALPMGKCFGVSGEGGGAALVAALSGYPVGARLLLGLKEEGKLARGEEFRLACLLTTSGPAFLVGTLGTMYGSAAAGWIVLVSHFCGIFAVCLLLRTRAKPLPPKPPSLEKTSPSLLYDSIDRAVVSALFVGGSIALFYCFCDMLSPLFGPISSLFGKNAPYAEGVLRGLVEMTTGCISLSARKTPLSLALSCGLVTFGGACVLCQETAFLSRAGVSAPRFLLVKLLQGALAFAICFALASLFPPL